MHHPPSTIFSDSSQINVYHYFTVSLLSLHAIHITSKINEGREKNNKTSCKLAASSLAHCRGDDVLRVKVLRVEVKKVGACKGEPHAVACSWKYSRSRCQCTHLKTQLRHFYTYLPTIYLRNDRISPVSRHKSAPKAPRHIRWLRYDRILPLTTHRTAINPESRHRSEKISF